MTAVFRVGPILVIAVVAWASAVARADDAGDKIIAAMDTALNKAKALSFDYEIINKEAGKNVGALTMKVLCKGQKRLYEFTSPADMKGTKVLILSPAAMYVYLPAFGKVRRIASHTKDQGFLGLCFSQDDLATSAYAADYSGTVIAETPAQVTVMLTPKASQEPAYAKIEVTLNKDGMVPSQLKYFNAAGANIKTQVCSGYTRGGDIYMPGELKMFDHIKGNWTRLSVKRLQVNPEIPDSVFATRKLEER